jgi:hypothetical protein
MKHLVPDAAQNKLLCFLHVSASWSWLTGFIHNTSFSLWFTNEPNRLACYITLGWNGLPRTNTLAYWLIRKSRRKRSVRQWIQSLKFTQTGSSILGIKKYAKTNALAYSGAGSVTKYKKSDMAFILGRQEIVVGEKVKAYLHI